VLLEPTTPVLAAMAAASRTWEGEDAFHTCRTGFNDMHSFSTIWKIPTAGSATVGEDYHASDERAK